MADSINLFFDEDGLARVYDDTYDIVIHCESKEEQDKVLATLNRKWIPCSKGLPKTKGMYYVTTKGKQEVARFVFTGTDSSKEYWRRNVLAWMPTPEPYRGKSE